MTAELKGLFLSGQYRLCLERGRSMLRESPLPAPERFRILAFIHRCRQALGGRTAEPASRGQSGRLRLVLARLHWSAGRTKAAVAEAYQALEEADALSPLQIRAQILLSQMAEATGRQVEALAFSLAARISAGEGGLHRLEHQAGLLMADQVRRSGWTTLAELADELAVQGIDLYDYLDPSEVLPLARD